MTYFIQLVTGFLGSLGFSVLFNIKKKDLLAASFGGILGWAVYLLFNRFIHHEYFSYFFAAVAINIYSEIFARIKKVPSTVILISSAVPLIPGSGLYKTMRFAVIGEWKNFSEVGISTLKYAFALALGIIIVNTILKIYASFRK